MSYIDKNHPIRLILDRAAGGESPTRVSLLALDRSDLPDGDDLARFRDDLSVAAQEVATIASVGAFGSARTRAQEHLAAFAEQMSDAEREIYGDENPEDVREISSRMFRQI